MDTLYEIEVLGHHDWATAHKFSGVTEDTAIELYTPFTDGRFGDRLVRLMADGRELRRTVALRAAAEYFGRLL